MADKRRDNKNRLFQKGEYQRPDGRYAYKYTDLTGKIRFVYSWTLTPTDRIPAGKKHDLCLREKIAQINRDLQDGIKPQTKDVTVAYVYSMYTSDKPNVKRKTQESRDRLQALLEEEPFGHMLASRVRLSDAKEWVVHMMKERDYSYGTINGYVVSLRAAYKLAIQEDYVRKNPFDFPLSEVLKNDTKPKDALTRQQQQALLEFAEHDPVYKKYFDEIVILLGTGLRISELCGLTDKDLDFEKRSINVDHQLEFSSGVGYYVNPPKTKNGCRKVPMSSEVYEAFQRVLHKRTNTQKPYAVDGYSGFLFLNSKGKPMYNTRYAHVFGQLVEKYNKCHEEALPDDTRPHVLRHTFCTNMALGGMSPKNLQMIMGHSSITTTMDYYAHFSFDSAKDEIDRLLG